MQKIFSEEEINDFKKYLSEIPSFENTLNTDKYFYPKRLGDEINTTEIVNRFKNVVLEFLKKLK